MAGEAPVFESTQRLTPGPQATITPQNVIVADTSAVGDAVSALGQAAVNFEAKLELGRQETQEADIKSKYLRKISDLRDAGTNSEDFKTALPTFQTSRQQAEDELLGSVLDDKRRADLRLYMTTHGGAAEKEVKNKQIANEADWNVARLNERSADYVRRAANAGSDVERDAILKDWNTDIDQQASAGWISQRDAVSRKVQGTQSLDDAGVLSLIRINPIEAQNQLRDPEKFKGLGPVQRQNLMTQAQAAADQLRTANLQNMATRDPARAAMIVGRVGGEVDGSAIFMRGIVPIESNGDPLAVSKKGALGLAQVMPDTAREVAAKLGLSDVAALDDAALKKRLLDDGALNLRLGKQYFNDMLARYDGNVAVALAAYNGGPGRADKWFAQAQEKYGSNFTPAQFAEVVNIGETRDYIGKVYGKIGAPMDGAGLSPLAQLHASTVVHAAIQGQESERVAAIKAIASSARDTDNPATIFAQGYDVDPVKYVGWKTQQLAAAAAGDPAAAKAVREAEFQREMLPFRQAALRMAPVDLEKLVGSEEARLAGSPNVSIDEKNRLDVAREVYKWVKEARNTNIIGLAEDAQMMPAGQRVAIDPRASSTDQNFNASLRIRGAQANAAASFYLGNAIALKPQELDAMKQRWNDAGPDEKFGLLQSFANNLTGRAYSDTVSAIGGGESVQVIGRLARERPDLAREILQGSELLKDKGVQEKSALIRPVLQEKLGQEIYPTAQMRESVVKAALALDASRRAARGSLYDNNDTSGLDKAIEDVAGKIVSRGGMKVPVPPGVNASSFHAALDRMDAPTVTMLGGVMDRDGREISPDTIAGIGALKALQPGGSLYVLGRRDAAARDGFSPFLTGDGGPVIIDMRTLAALQSNVKPTRYDEMRSGLRQERIARDAKQRERDQQ